MAERQPGQSRLNWSVIWFGALVLVMAVALIPDQFLRAIAAIFIFVTTFFIAQSREAEVVENPLLEHARMAKPGLDRRKYGHLRSATERLLEQVREMNRIAIEGREGKLSQRHAHAELDRLAAKMVDLVDDIRKSAGIPTPTEEKPESEQVVRPKVVIPRAKSGPERGPSGVAAERGQPPGARDAADEELDRLVAEAEAEARGRAAAVEPEGPDAHTHLDETGAEGEAGSDTKGGKTGP